MENLHQQESIFNNDEEEIFSRDIECDPLEIHLLGETSCSGNDSCADKTRGLVCEFAGCDKVFPSKWKLYQHHRVHTGERPFVCELCSKAFKIKDALNRHRHTHSKDKPYRCSVQGCNKSFSTSHNLKYHLATHSDNKPFVCDYPGCSKSFHTKSQLKQHMRTKTVHQKLDLEQTPSSTKKTLIGNPMSPLQHALSADSTSASSSLSGTSSLLRERSHSEEVVGDSDKQQVSIIKHISKQTQRQDQKIRNLEDYIRMMQKVLSVNNISLPSIDSDDAEDKQDAMTHLSPFRDDDDECLKDDFLTSSTTPSTETGSFDMNVEHQESFLDVTVDSSSIFNLVEDSAAVFESITPLEIDDAHAFNSSSSFGIFA